MPTILHVGRLRFFFYSSDRPEPLRVHVDAGRGTAKFWLDPVRLAGYRGLTAREVSRAWHAYFDA
jgi:hypothetical protein